MIDTLEELCEEIAKILPSASFGFDNEGQIVIYTDLTINSDNLISPMSADDVQ